MQLGTDMVLNSLGSLDGKERQALEIALLSSTTHTGLQPSDQTPW